MPAPSGRYQLYLAISHLKYHQPEPYPCRYHRLPLFSESPKVPSSMGHPASAGQCTPQMCSPDEEPACRTLWQDHLLSLLPPGTRLVSKGTNAKQFLVIQKEFGSFYNYTLSFFPDRNPIINHFQSLSEIPVSSPESDAMSKDMKKRGFKFFGSTICYAHLQASGFINDHLTDCICRNQKQ